MKRWEAHSLEMGNFFDYTLHASLLILLKVQEKSRDDSDCEHLSIVLYSVTSTEQ
jgi:hypothetical protein